MDDKSLKKFLSFILRKTKVKYFDCIKQSELLYLQLDSSNTPAILLVHHNYHWYLLHIYKDGFNYFRANLFDSFGKDYSALYFSSFPPIIFGYNWNNLKVQSKRSNTCGIFCLYVAHFLARGCSLHHVIKHFSKSTTQNELRIKKFYQKLVKHAKVDIPLLFSVPQIVYK